MISKITLFSKQNISCGTVAKLLDGKTEVKLNNFSCAKLTL
jgi:hypothetical protein